MDFLAFLILFSVGAFVVGLICGAMMKGNVIGAIIVPVAVFFLLMVLHMPINIETIAVWRHEYPQNALVWFGVYAFYFGLFASFSLFGYCIGGRLRRPMRCDPERKVEQGGAGNEDHHGGF